MARPVILAVDDDPEVLRAVARDLRSKYAEEHRVLRAGSGDEALDALRDLRLADEPVALLVVDQRMPGMTGVQFLRQAIEHYPGVKRVLLTAYADTEAAIQAINDVHIDHYLLKPWDPPEERLYPVLDDLLDEWMATYRPAFEGVRMVGHRWSPDSHRARDFLARNRVPYQWHDLATDPEAEELMQLAKASPLSIPVLLFPEGPPLIAPSNEEIAQRLGMHVQANLPLYDLVVVGGGPAGLAAAVYGASEGLKTVVLERSAAGGQAGSSSLIENYLGFPGGVSGSELARRAQDQMTKFGAEFLLTRGVTGLEAREGSTTLLLEGGASLDALSVVIATGVSYRRLEVPGCEELTGRGVYYGAAPTEADALEGEEVYIVGGANSAGQAAVHFARKAKLVTMLIRGDSLSGSMSSYLDERIQRTDNVKVRCRTQVARAIGTDRLEALELHHADTGEMETVPATTLFVFIGAVPPTEWLGPDVMLDPQGFVLTGRDLLIEGKLPRNWGLDRDPLLLETSAPGVFAAGDVRHGSAKRVAAAVGEGSMAVMSVWQYRASIGL